MPRRLARTVLPDHLLVTNPFLPDGEGDGGTGGGGGQGGGGNGGGSDDGAGSGDGSDGDGSGEGEGTGDGPDYKAIARRMEQRANADKRAREAAEAERAELKKRLEALEADRMSDTEKATKKAAEEAAAAARKETVGQYAARLVGAEARAALAGRGLEPDVLKELVEDAKALTRLQTADGEPDEEAIAAWADRVAPKPKGDSGGTGGGKGEDKGKGSPGGRMPPLGQGRQKTADGPTGAAAGAALWEARHGKKQNQTT